MAVSPNRQRPRSANLNAPLHLDQGKALPSGQSRPVLQDGSLSLAAQLPPDLTEGSLILSVGPHWAAPGGLLALWHTPDGRLRLRHRTPEKAIEWQSARGFARAGDHLRVVAQVWQSQRLGMLCAENSETGECVEVCFDRMPAIPLHNPTSDLPLGDLSVELAHVPLSPRGQSVFAAGSRVMTPEGPRPIEDLAAGDPIVTRAGIIRLVSSELHYISDVGLDSLITLRAPYLGLDQDLTLLPDQRVQLDGPEVEIHYGKPAVLVRARDLQTGRAALRGADGPMYRLRFEQSVELGFGRCTVFCAGTADLIRSGAPRELPGFGRVPWATRAEASALAEAYFRRVGVIPRTGAGY